MVFKDKSLYIIHDKIPLDELDWRLYLPKLFYIKDGKKFDIINSAPSWTEKFLKKKPIGTYELSKNLPKSISSQILKILYESKRMKLHSIFLEISRKRKKGSALPKLGYSNLGDLLNRDIEARFSLINKPEIFTLLKIIDNNTYLVQNTQTQEKLKLSPKVRVYQI